MIHIINAALEQLLLLIPPNILIAFQLTRLTLPTTSKVTANYQILNQLNNIKLKTWRGIPNKLKYSMQKLTLHTY